ncbi:MAG: threonylcarbamoyl-AMP synthase [Sphingobacteriaceae bacterium]|nr:threonylcarbamoyl-AMP synthase [Sphingobacteriaceae bacterium]
MEQIGKNIDLAAKFLKEGDLVAIPSETVYGLAANALNEKAVFSIFTAKNRPHFDPLIVHIKNAEQIDLYAEWEDDRLKKLADKFWPGPLTLLLQKKEIIPDIVTSGLSRVALRVPNHELALDLLNKLEFPLAAPSANPFGYISPTTAQHVQDQLADRVAYILDGGACRVGLESTIVGVEDGKILIYRLGGLSVEEIKNAIGDVTLSLIESSDPKAPGQLKSHYAPKKPLYFGDAEKLMQQHSNKKIALLLFGKTNLKSDFNFNLSEKADVLEAAKNLFDMLRQADNSEAEIVIAQLVPDENLGKAINDRLKRAAV